MPFIAASALFAAIGGYLIWHEVFGQHVFAIDDEGVVVTRGDRTIQRLAWREIRGICALQRYGVLRLQGPSGIAIDVPYSVEGIDELTDQVSRRSGCTIEPRTG